jgi:hypothetical protein
MTLKIQKSSDLRFVTFTLSGRIEVKNMAQLQLLLAKEPGGSILALDLKEVQLVDHETVMFLARIEKEGIKLENCAAYIREWISREQDTR